MKRRSVILMLVFTLVTLGFYYPLWFLRRRRGLNQLNSPRKLRLWPFIVLFAFFAVTFVVGFVAAPGTPKDLIGEGPSLFLDLLQLAIAILVIVQCFVIKDILEDHLAGAEDVVPSVLTSSAVQLSGLLTFFFQIYYLQHVINRDVLASPPPTTAGGTAFSHWR